AKAVDDIDDARRQARFFEPVGKFKNCEWSLLGRLEHASAAGGNGRSEFPGGHEQRVIPGNNLAGDADGFAHGEAQSVGRNGIHVAGDLVGETAVILEAGRDVGNVELGFDDGFAGVAAFEFGEL